MPCLGDVGLEAIAQLSVFFVDIVGHGTGDSLPEIMNYPSAQSNPSEQGETEPLLIIEKRVLSEKWGDTREGSESG